jgi:glutamine synthetase
MNSIEFRPPDATCNIYLALAAQLLAGLDGIRREIDPTEAGFGPIEADVFSWSEERRAAMLHLYQSVVGALGQSRVEGQVTAEQLLTPIELVAP